MIFQFVCDLKFLNLFVIFSICLPFLNLFVIWEKNLLAAAVRIRLFPDCKTAEEEREGSGTKSRTNGRRAKFVNESAHNDNYLQGLKMYYLLNRKRVRKYFILSAWTGWKWREKKHFPIEMCPQNLYLTPEISGQIVTIREYVKIDNLKFHQITITITLPSVHPSVNWVISPPLNVE